MERWNNCFVSYSLVVKINLLLLIQKVIYKSIINLLVSQKSLKDLVAGNVIAGYFMIILCVYVYKHIIRLVPPNLDF